MILVKVRYNQDRINEVTVSGHSGYDELGKDIVCSAVNRDVRQPGDDLKGLSPLQF